MLDDGCRSSKFALVGGGGNSRNLDRPLQTQTENGEFAAYSDHSQKSTQQDSQIKEPVCGFNVLTIQHQFAPYVIQVSVGWQIYLGQTGDTRDYLQPSQISG